MNYDATKSYVQKYSLKSIFQYSYELKKHLIEELINEFDLTFVDAPIFQEYDDSLVISFISAKSRTISFSSESTGMFLEIPIYYDMVRKFMLHKYSENGINGIIYDTPVICRDAKLDNLTSIKTYQLEVEFNLPSEIQRSANGMAEMISRISSMLISVIDKVNYKLGFGKSIVETFPTVLLTNLIHKYGNLKLQKLINLYTEISNTFFLIDDLRIKRNFDSAFHFLFSTHKMEGHAKLITKFEQLGTTGVLAEFAFSANYQEHLNQLQILHHIENNKFSKMLQQNKLKNTFAMKFYIPQLVMQLLELIHIGEVVKSKWPDDFLTFIKKHGTNIA